MNRSQVKRCGLVGACAAFTLLLGGCVATGGGYGYGDNVGVGVGLDYYEPVGGYYGGWGGGYRVGPYHDRHDRYDHGGGRPAPHYRPSAPSHRMPSIPSGPRGGGHSRGH